MTKYAVSYIEQLSRTYIVEADNADDAYDAIYNATSDGKIVLDADDFDDWEIIVNKASDWQIEDCETYNPED